jgi:hypothetical protein
LKADFGSGTWDGGPIGIPFVVVPGSQQRVPVSFEYADESDPGPYPIPPDAPIEGGPNSTGDRHILVVDRDNCVLYETWSTYPSGQGWTAGSGARFDLRSNALRPAGWTSSDAAGLPVLPGLVRYDEIAAGQIPHALRFTASRTQRAYLWPARHYASSITDPNVPPMGARVRLKASYDISGFAADNRIILQALKTYGMLLADNGSNWYISGVPDERWNNSVLAALRNVPGSAFEVVDASSLMVDPNSGRVAGGSPPPSTATATPTAQASSTPTSVPPTATRTPTSPPATASRTPTSQPPTPTRTPTATSVAAPSATATPTASQTVVIGGSALGDTWITPDEPGVRHGTWGAAHLQGSYTPDRLLFLPNLSSIPTGATIERATLEVYAYDANSSGNTLAAHQILKSWNVSQATHTHATSSSRWTTAGLGAGTDYATTPVGTATLGGTGWMKVDVTSAVKSWRSGSTNRGLMLRLSAGAPNAHYRVYLAEATNASLRPKLSVVYR